MILQMFKIAFAMIILIICKVLESKQKTHYMYSSIMGNGYNHCTDQTLMMERESIACLAENTMHPLKLRHYGHDE